MAGASDKPKLGSLFLQKKLLASHDVDAVLKAQRSRPGTRFASLAVELGKISAVDAVTVLSEQQDLPAIDLEQVVLALDDLKLIPHFLAKKHGILVVSVKDDEVILAMADAGNRRYLDEIEYVVGKRVSAYLALQGTLATTIEDVYRRYQRGDQLFTGKAVPAEHMRALGLDPAQPASIPPAADLTGAAQQAVVGLKDLPTDDEVDFSFAGLFDEDAADKAPVHVPKPTMLPAAPVESYAPATPKRPTLDRAFESRVAPVPQRPSMVPESSGATILVVDEVDDVRKLLARLLNERGYRVLEAKRGADAVGLVRDREPELILLDATLPDMHGFDLCRRLKGSEKYGHIPIIVMSDLYSGWRVAEDLKEAFGVYSFIEKPFKVGDVVKQVQRALGGRAPYSASETEQLTEAAKECLERGIEAFKAGDLDKAIEDMKRGISIDPGAYRLHYHLGLLYGRKDEKIFEAISALQMAVDLSPRSFSALKNLAVLYQRVSFKHKAVEMWERALTHAPDEETRRGIKDHVVGLL